jgi:hypothetical protein
MKGLRTDMDFDTRRKRRDFINSIHASLTAIRDAEQRCLGV